MLAFDLGTSRDDPATIERVLQDVVPCLLWDWVSFACLQAQLVYTLHGVLHPFTLGNHSKHPCDKGTTLRVHLQRLVLWVVQVSQGSNPQEGRMNPKTIRLQLKDENPTVELRVH